MTLASRLPKAHQHASSASRAMARQSRRKQITSKLEVCSHIPPSSREDATARARGESHLREIVAYLHGQAFSQSGRISCFRFCSHSAL